MSGIERDTSAESRYSLETKEYAPGLFGAKFIPSTFHDSYALAELYGKNADYVNRQLGTRRLYEFDSEKEGVNVGFEMAKTLIQESGVEPDVVIYVKSHLPDPDETLEDPYSTQHLAKHVWEGVISEGIVSPRDKIKPEIAHTESAACSGFLGGVDWMLENVPDGSRVMMLVDETDYRKNLPEITQVPEDGSISLEEIIEKNRSADSGGSNELFGDVGCSLFFEKGRRGMEYYPVLTIQEDDENCDLGMNVAVTNPDDPYVRSSFVPHAEKFKMNGPKVAEYFKPHISSEKLVGYLQRVGIDPGDVEGFFSHQASNVMLRRVEAAANEAALNLSHFSRIIGKYGNISSASVPMGILDALEKKQVQPGNGVHLAVNFGAGFRHAWGAFKVNEPYL